jgi:hypothetical protein
MLTGVLDSALKLNITKEYLLQRTLNIVPDRDIVSTVGTLEGTVATWQCPLDFVTCHFPGVQLCHLMKLCPSALSHLDCKLIPPRRQLREQLAKQATRVWQLVLGFLFQILPDAHGEL